MKNRLLSRTCLSPITCVTFFVVVITGILLAFHFRNASVRALHEWIGYVFMAAGLLHLLLNLRAFVAYFRERHAIMAMLAAIIVSMAVFFSGGSCEGQRHGQEGGQSLLRIFDTNGNGIIDAEEIADAATPLHKLDINHDGVISGEELGQGRRGRGGPPD